MNELRLAPVSHVTAATALIADQTMTDCLPTQIMQLSSVQCNWRQTAHNSNWIIPSYNTHHSVAMADVLKSLNGLNSLCINVSISFCDCDDVEIDAGHSYAIKFGSLFVIICRHTLANVCMCGHEVIYNNDDDNERQIW